MENELEGYSGAGRVGYTAGTQVAVNTTLVEEEGSPATHRQLYFAFVLLVGIFGNIIALYMLKKAETARNSKQIYLLRCLAGKQ